MINKWVRRFFIYLNIYFFYNKKKRWYKEVFRVRSLMLFKFIRGEGVDDNGIVMCSMMGKWNIFILFYFVYGWFY